MTRKIVEPRPDPASSYIGLMEMVTVIVISAAGLMASWASHQGAMWNGKQSLHFVRANAQRGDAAKARLEGELIRGVEVDLFSDWIEAKSRGNETLARFYRTRMPVAFRPSFEAWLATRPLENPDAPPTPFAMEGYRPPRFALAERADKAAIAEFAQGEEATRISYAYNRAGVVFATAMFFGGIGQAFQHKAVRLALAAVTIVTWIIGLQLVLAIPALPLRQVSPIAEAASPATYPTDR
jgi:hypothetical protein